MDQVLDHPDLEQEKQAFRNVLDMPHCLGTTLEQHVESINQAFLQHIKHGKKLLFRDMDQAATGDYMHGTELETFSQTFFRNNNDNNDNGLSLAIVEETMSPMELVIKGKGKIQIAASIGAVINHIVQLPSMDECIRDQRRLHFLVTATKANPSCTCCCSPLRNKHNKEDEDNRRCFACREGKSWNPGPTFQVLTEIAMGSCFQSLGENESYLHYHHSCLGAHMMLAESFFVILGGMYQEIEEEREEEKEEHQNHHASLIVTFMKYTYFNSLHAAGILKELEGFSSSSESDDDDDDAHRWIECKTLQRRTTEDLMADIIKRCRTSDMAGKQPSEPDGVD